jgi:hypothetical protein
MRVLKKCRLEYMIRSYERVKFIVDNGEKMTVRELMAGSGFTNEDIKVVMAVFNMKRPKRIKDKKEKPKYISQSFERPQAVYDNRQFV